MSSKTAHVPSETIKRRISFTAQASDNFPRDAYSLSVSRLARANPSAVALRLRSRSSSKEPQDMRIDFGLYRGSTALVVPALESLGLLAVATFIYFLGFLSSAVP